MNRFFCLYNSSCKDSLDLQARLDSLQSACRYYDVLFKGIDEATVDVTTLPTPTANDGLYNCARGSYLLEKMLMNRQVRTFYRNYEVLSQKDDCNILTIELEKHGIATPKTIYKGTNNKKLLTQYMEYLEGFPVVIKTYGGVSGVGVVTVDSFSGLFSLADYLVKRNEEFQIKQFIPSNTCERVTVLGNKVLYSISRPIKANEFRSDGHSPKAKTIELGKEINQLAVKAAHASNLNFAGIDIIINSKDGKGYVLEVNMPHNFAQHEKIAGKSYSRAMIKWLFEK